MLDLLYQNVYDGVNGDVKASPCYSLMEVSDNRILKHLALCSRYISYKGELTTSFLVNIELQNETITNSIITELNKQKLLLQDMTGFASDGAAVFLGNQRGVAKRLKDINGSLVTSHCRDHRLALACRDSFNAVLLMKKADYLLDKLYKYYKYSCNRTASLKAVQSAFNQAPLSVKQAKHHRWLSHDQGVSNIVKSYQSIVTDLETSNISSDAVGNGILKGLKDITTMRSLLLLADVLPTITVLSLVFQRRDVNLGMVKTNIDKTMKNLEARNKQDDPWLLKIIQMCKGLKLTITPASDFNSKVKAPFLEKMVSNVNDRFVGSDIIEQLSVLDLTGTSDELPILYGYSEMFTIAEHFKMVPEELQGQWQDFLQLFSSMETQDRTMISLIKLLHNASTGLQEMYPLVYKILCISTVLPLSTAEVERVFSQVKLIKTNHRSSLKTSTLNKL